jgi:exosome complex RNA-binding protein Rrp42 (RNase PH superfamily)
MIDNFIYISKDKWESIFGKKVVMLSADVGHRVVMDPQAGEEDVEDWECEANNVGMVS